jgi:shikimate dehydrogenase
MHNVAFDALGLNWRYIPLPVLPQEVDIAVQGLRGLGFRGANVTVPHKQAVIASLDETAPNASRLGAVNTIVVERTEGGSAVLRGHNTDDQGFIKALREGGYEPEEGKGAIVVGAGGAARAVVAGLLWAGLRDILVLNRTIARAESLVSDLKTSSPLNSSGRESRLHALPLRMETLVESVRSADLLVNTTTLGMWPNVDTCIWPDRVPVPSHLTVFDAVYNPLETRLLEKAREAGARAIDGLGMLLAQGAIAFEMWTGHSPPIGVMREACELALTG